MIRANKLKTLSNIMLVQIQRTAPLVFRCLHPKSLSPK